MASLIDGGLVKHNSRIIKFACACAFLTVITTIGIHSSLFDFGPLNAEQNALLFNNSWYHFGKWWVIVHCLLVIFSMWGVLLVIGRQKIHLTAIGFIFYCVFAFTEIFRQLLALFYLNGLRQNYLDAADDTIRSMIQSQMDNFGLFAYGMFGLFVLAFAAGNLIFGLSLIRGQFWDNVLGGLLLIWACQGFLVLCNEFWGMDWLSNAIENFSLIFQPFVRFVLGIWLMKKILGAGNLGMK
jgi:hypothetical protein